MREILSLPEEFAVAAVLALGYPQRTVTKLKRREVSEFTSLSTVLTGAPFAQRTTLRVNKYFADLLIARREIGKDENRRNHRGSPGDETATVKPLHERVGDAGVKTRTKRQRKVRDGDLGGASRARGDLQLRARQPVTDETCECRANSGSEQG